MKLKTVGYAVAVSLALTGAVKAGGLAEPVMEPEVIVEETAGTSAGGIIVPLLLLVLIAVASSGGNGGGGSTF